jgi:4'-phosphopantetheinyl transferase
VSLLDLPADEVHVHYLLPDEIVDPLLLAAYESWLAPVERERRARYRFEHSRREYLLTRALVRGTLSRYAAVEPAAWTFRENDHGRPEIARADLAWLRFNLSNTSGLIAIAIVRDRDVGVDVEDTQRRGETVEIADSFFSPTEVASLRALPAGAQKSRFFDYWTLKEAYIKARGLGLAIPLHQFSFLLDEAPPIRVAFVPELGDDAATWQFEQLAITARHRAAAAVRRGLGPDLRFVVQQTVPAAR